VITDDGDTAAGIVERQGKLTSGRPLTGRPLSWGGERGIQRGQSWRIVGFSTMAGHVVEDERDL